MKSKVKTLALITAILSFTPCFAQLKLPSVNTVANDIRKVIEDYPNGFHNISGEEIIRNPQSTDYKCNFNVSGAEESTITRYTSKRNDVCSWQALMLTTEDFEKARQKFRMLFNQINNLSIKSSQLKGTWEQPAEEKKFSSVVFSFEPADESMKHLKVEVAMQYELLEWKVRVLVYNKEREDYERGQVEEN